MSSLIQISKYVNDIALIHLSDPVEWSQHVQPICLPDFEEEKFYGQQGLLAGWGFDMEGECFPNIYVPDRWMWTGTLACLVCPLCVCR